MLKTPEQLEVAEKTVLLRVDFNVPFDEEGKILEDYRILAVKPTIEYLLKQGSRIVLLSHLSAPNKLRAGFKEPTLAQVALRASELFGVKVDFLPEIFSAKTEKYIREMKGGQLVLLENLRSEPGEEKNDEAFAAKLAGLGDVYINDAFGVCHRSHASLVSLPKLLPSAAGFLVAREIAVLEEVLKEISVATLIVGGAKISTKIKFIGKFLKEAANVLVGGALANNLLQREGLAVGRSLVEKDLTETDFEEIDLTSAKLHLPLDVLVARETENGLPEKRGAGNIKDDELIFDIGPETLELFCRIIQASPLVVWNGPMGFFEKEEFFAGTAKIAQCLAGVKKSVIGGGETVLAAQKAGTLGAYWHISTGGGSMMDFLSGEELPALKALNYY